MVATSGFAKCFSLNKTQLHENQQKMLDWAAILKHSSLLGSKKLRIIEHRGYCSEVM